MVTFAGKQNDLPDIVKSLLTLEQNILSAYDKAVDRVDTETYLENLRRFRTDHARAIIRLSHIAEDIPIPVPGKGPKSIYTSGKIVLADIDGDDMILRAMETNEKDMRKAYMNASGNMLVDNSLYEVCSDALRDIERHIDWLRKPH